MIGRALAAVAFALALAAPAPAVATRYAVGLEPTADPDVVHAEILRRTGIMPRTLDSLHALVVDAPARPAIAGIPGVRYVELLTRRRLAVVPNDPFVSRQWYLAQNRSYDTWAEMPLLEPVRVAVIDSGIDGSHPELASHIVAARSFVGGSARQDTQGHGTFVAGLIAAGANDGVGIAGLAPSAELIVAKVVSSSGTIPVEAEAKAIRWAVDQRARVINMSLSGLRDPTDSSRDTYSQLEADAVAYAVRKGVVVVAAVGNSDQAPSQPWRFASYPAALPHVLGVSALGRFGAAPDFSNRDAQYNDIAAPGRGILSTFPLALTGARPACVEQGYSSCGPDNYREAEGTSFAAPQVSAAAAMLIASAPGITAEQVITVLERSAVDATAANGCARCRPGRDAFTGFGHLDVAAALAALVLPLPASDSHEPNDDAGTNAFTLWGSQRLVEATYDYWDDRDDVYRVFVRRGQRLFASLSGAPGTDPALALWSPGTTSVNDPSLQDQRVRLSARSGQGEYLGYRAPTAGWYFLHVKLGAQGSGRYRLSVVKD